MTAITLHHNPTNTNLVINALYAATDDVIFVENHFECECPGGFIYDKSVSSHCPDCGASADESPDARLSDWCDQNDLEPLAYGLSGLNDFVNNEDVVKLHS